MSLVALAATGRGRGSGTGSDNGAAFLPAALGRSAFRLPDRLAHLPLAHFVAAAAFGQIDVDMFFVIAVGARAEHR